MKVGIIGGGASGMFAAITAADAGAYVTVLEKNERVGKKLLVTGNGKCNLSNLNFYEGAYHSDDREVLPDILKQFTVSDTLVYFKKIGLLTREKDGYVYPRCEQASAVLDILRNALEQKGVKVVTGCKVVSVVRKEASGTYELTTDLPDRKQKKFFFDRVILACGSKAGIGNPSSYNGHKLAEGLGLCFIPQLPALVQLKCREPFMKALGGVRCQAQVKIGDLCEQGELQMTDYGISGIPVFQISRHVLKLLNTQKEIKAELNFMPEYSAENWKSLMEERRECFPNISAEQFFVGTVHKKIIPVVLKQCNIKSNCKICGLSSTLFGQAVNMFLHFPVTICGANSFEQAQVCAGGVKLTEVRKTMECKKYPGLYLTGEILDVDGRCGGYNLQWAWTSGAVAGKNAAGVKD